MRPMQQAYTAEDSEVWRRLFSRQQHHLTGKATRHYLRCLEDLAPYLNSASVPCMESLSAALEERSGWMIRIVPGLIPAADFLGLLARRQFCSSTWLRRPAQLDYLEEPDMFHDIFGHVPLLCDERYARFMQELGLLGLRLAGHEQAIALLERFYWFTIEFGLLEEDGCLKIYGAGILSSYLETAAIYKGQALLHPFDLDAILDRDFTKSELQQEYFVLPSPEVLYACLPQLEAGIARRTSAALAL